MKNHSTVYSPIRFNVFDHYSVQSSEAKKDSIKWIKRKIKISRGYAMKILNCVLTTDFA